MQLLGEILALTTAVCWSFGTILFSFAGRRVGAFAINVVRISFAAISLLLLNILFAGNPLDALVHRNQMFMLVLSSILGLVLADGFYFKAMIILGPRLATLITACTPIFATFFSWIILRQQLGWIDLVGIGITVAGVASVTFERIPKKLDAPSAPHLSGYLFGLLASVGQAAALVTAKIGMGDNISPLNAAWLRMFAAAVVIWVIAVFRRRLRSIIRVREDRKTINALLGAAIIGPTIGMWLSLVSIKYAPVGIAATLMAMTPVLIIPLVMMIHKERPSIRSILGTIVAVGGAAVLFLY